MIWARCLEKLLKMIHGLLRLVLKITLGGSYELLIRIISAFVITVLVAAVGDHDSQGLSNWRRSQLMGASPWPPLTALGASFCTLVGGYGRSSMSATHGCLPAVLHEDCPTASLPEACLVAMSRGSLVVFGCLRPSSCTRVQQVIPDQNVDITSASCILGSSWHF
jgi:hypothetical protein